MKHGIYWVIAKNQDLTRIYIDYGTRKPDDTFTVPMQTIECDHEFNHLEPIKSSGAFRSIRYFEEKK